MDGQPDDADPVHAAERAQWERAGRVRKQHEAEALERAEVRASAAPTAEPERTSRRLAWLAVVVVVVFLAAVGVMLVAIRHGFNQQPAWVAQLGLNTAGTTPGPAPARLGTPASGAPEALTATDPSASTTIRGLRGCNAPTPMDMGKENATGAVRKDAEAAATALPALSTAAPSVIVYGV